MSATEPHTAPPPFQHRWYQFTLREMLLASLAFCLLCALLASHRHSTTTSFFRSFRGGQALAAAFAHSGVKLVSADLLPGESYDVQGDITAVRTWQILLHKLPTGKVIVDLEDEVEGLLRKDGCRVHFTGGPAQPDDEPPQNFYLQYSKGGTEGYVHVYVERNDMMMYRWRLTFLLHESVKYGPIGR